MTSYVIELLMPANPLEPYTLHVTHLKSSVIIDLKFRLPDEEGIANGKYTNVTEDSWKLQALSCDSILQQAASKHLLPAQRRVKRKHGQRQNSYEWRQP